MCKYSTYKGMSVKVDGGTLLHLEKPSSSPWYA